MDSQKLKAILIVVVAAFVALYLGVAAATAQLEAIAWVVGVATVVFILLLGKHVWVLVPITLGLAGNINFLPGAPPPWWMAVGVVCTMLTIRFLLRTRELTFRFNWLDFAILLQMVAIGQAFLRNPAGISLFGTDTVGGKPYFIFTFAAIAFALLSVVKTDLRIVKWVVICTILMAFIDGGLMVASVLIPSLAAAVLPIYSGVSFASATTGAENADIGDARFGGAQDIGRDFGKAAFTLFRPITTLNPLNPIRFILMLGSIGFILISGYRSALAMVACYAIISSLLRRKVLDVVICGILAIFGLGILIATDKVQSLPFGAQRILSVLPINVRAEAREDADKSSEWRFEMWRLALTTDRYISNKLLGDGFGYSRDEMKAMQDAAFGDTRSSSRFKGIDAMMTKGSYHGFHVEAIRMTGVFGLLCALIALGIFFNYAWKQIQFFRGRPEWGYILYICIPFLIYPFYLLLVFGAYRMGFPALLASAGMLKVLDNIRVREIAEARFTANLPEKQPIPQPGLPHTGRPLRAFKSI